MDKTEMLYAAKEYARMGFRVFPLAYRGKIPTTKNGVKDATTDINQIEEWWNNAPFANIGIAMGNGFMCVDIDKDDIKGYSGFDSLRDWEKTKGEFPESAMALTGRGGNHIIYRVSQDVGNRASVIPNVDIRGEGGYIVAPPSYHPNGNRYVWENDIDEYGIADANDSVLALARMGIENKVDDKGISPLKDKLVVPDVIKDGTRNDMLYKKACSMQGYGASDSEIYEYINYLASNRCETPIEQGSKEYDDLQKTIASALTKTKGNRSRKKDNRIPFQPLDIVSASDLYDMDFPETDWLVKDILPAGICILCAAPKSGKSWMVLDLAIQCSKGGNFLGHKCKQTGVLYLALEDSLARLSSRMKKLSPSKLENFHLCIESQQLCIDDGGMGLLAQLYEALEAKPDIGLIIIDTLQMVSPKKGGNEDGYQHTYALLNAIRPLYQDRKVCVMFVHHTRKSNGFEVDPFETILGSQALAGATDGMYIIQRKKGDEYSKFFGRGRDFEEFELAIRMDKDSRWQNYGDVDDIEENELHTKYLESPFKEALDQLLEEEEKGLFGDKKVILTAAELWDEVLNRTGRRIGSNEREFIKEVSEFDEFLFQDGIKHTSCRTTRAKDKRKALFHIYEKKECT